MQPQPSTFMFMLSGRILDEPYTWRIMIHAVCPQCKSPEAMLGSTDEGKTVINCTACQFYAVHDVNPSELEKAILAEAAERLA